MTLYLIEYNRGSGKIVFVNSFDRADRAVAESARLELELTNLDNEVVLLESSSDRALEQTHGRYFEDLEEIARMATS
jgi:hypothetical protein